MKLILRWLLYDVSFLIFPVLFFLFFFLRIVFPKSSLSNIDFSCVEIDDTLLKIIIWFGKETVYSSKRLDRRTFFTFVVIENVVVFILGLHFLSQNVIFNH